ncbi:unnamed protein product, partial [Linum tenue]
MFFVVLTAAPLDRTVSVVLLPARVNSTIKLALDVLRRSDCRHHPNLQWPSNADDENRDDCRAEGRRKDGDENNL